MESIGQLLKMERERRGLAIDDVQEAMKYTPQNIIALEEDRFDEFPNRVYARAYIREYANFLGLDSSALLEMYEGGSKEAAIKDENGAGQKKSVLKVVFASILVVVLLCGIAAAAYYVIEYRKSNGIHYTNVDRQTGPSSVLPNVNVNPNVDNPSKKPSKDKAKPEAPTDKLVMEIVALRPVWLSVKTDGNRVMYQTIPAGKKTFEAKKSIYIRAGQSDSVQVKINGKDQVIGEVGQPAEKEFKIEDFVTNETTPLKTNSGETVPIQSSKPSNGQTSPINP